MVRSWSFLVALVACADPPAPRDTGEKADTAAGDTADTADTDDSDLPVDADGDGSPEGEDCDDADADVFPGAVEACNGRDDDCDGAPGADEGTDEDGDGDPSCLDCDDLDPAFSASDGSCGAYRFPLGYFSTEDAADFPTLAAHGIRWVHAYNFGPWPGNDVAVDVAWSQAYLDEAEANGLTVLANLHGRTRAEEAASLDEFSTFVDAVADHPALGAWYLADEPEFTVQAEDLADMQAVLKTARPDLPVQISHCWCTDWWSFWNVGDVRMPDFYGIYADPDPSPNALYHPVFTSYHNTYYTESAIEPVMQGFSYAVFSDEDPVTYPPESRFPTAGELRFWAFADLTLGVKGLWWWSWYRANQHEDGAAWLDGTFYPALDEIAAFTDAVSPASHPVSVNPGPYDLIDYTYLAYWPRPAGTFVVAANGRDEAATLEITLGEAFAGQTLVPWDDTSPQVTLDETGAATADAGPYEVLVWVAE